MDTAILKSLSAPEKWGLVLDEIERHPTGVCVNWRRAFLKDRARKKMMLKIHPDKHLQKSSITKCRAEQLFKFIQACWDVTYEKDLEQLESYRSIRTSVRECQTKASVKDREEDEEKELAAARSKERQKKREEEAREKAGARREKRAEEVRAKKKKEKEFDARQREKQVFERRRQEELQRAEERSESKSSQAQSAPTAAEHQYAEFLGFLDDRIRSNPTVENVGATQMLDMLWSRFMLVYWISGEQWDLLLPHLPNNASRKYVLEQLYEFIISNRQPLELYEIAKLRTRKIRPYRIESVLRRIQKPSLAMQIRQLQKQAIGFELLRDSEFVKPDSLQRAIKSGSQKGKLFASQMIRWIAWEMRHVFRAMKLAPQACATAAINPEFWNTHAEELEPTCDYTKTGEILSMVRGLIKAHDLKQQFDAHMVMMGSTWWAADPTGPRNIQIEKLKTMLQLLNDSDLDQP